MVVLLAPVHDVPRDARLTDGYTVSCPRARIVDGRHLAQGPQVTSRRTALRASRRRQ
ncbi:hypothetical protein PMI40_04618 [Herbaspirillum sp. YR522]|nr:hypothetical protein PMI40_04618 [Herbaspirillum sp. YR522]